ncbi:hypothetical protein [Micromonospora sp. NPDC051006]|uniref:hypothetical protein n=1 Tax=Micromonospora sp. NPDC051006 TaxID=3364283 RepID=UPI0037B3FA17
MTFDGPNSASGAEPRSHPAVPLRKMWIFAALGAVAAVVALLIAPTNPAGWILLASLGGLAWFTRAELRRRRTV